MIVVSCGAINSAALLLRSANDKHPRGLANSSDIVGRHYMGHTNSVMMAISKCPNPTIFQKTLGVNDFYFGSNDFEYPMGHISFVGKLDAITLKAGAPAIAPNFTLDLMAKHSLDFWLTSEDLPDPNNRVTIGRDGKIVLTYTPNNLEAHERLQGKLKQAMKQTNCSMHGHECHQGLFGRNLYVGQRIPLAGVAHQNGTIRFGHDPKTSALDVNCKAHDVDNLYVVDGSFFPSSAAVNPALTIMANALRVGDHLMKRLGVSQNWSNQFWHKPETVAPASGRPEGWAGRPPDSRRDAGATRNLMKRSSQAIRSSYRSRIDPGAPGGPGRSASLGPTGSCSDRRRRRDRNHRLRHGSRSGFLFQSPHLRKGIGHRSRRRELRASRGCVRVAHARGANEAGRRVHRTHRVSRAQRPPDPG